MRDSSGLSRRAVLGLAAAVPLAATTAATAYATSTIGGARLARSGVQTSGASGLPEHLTARSWLVADHTTGEVLASYNAHLRLPPASTLKMLFADTVLKKFERAQTYKVVDADLADVPAGSSLVGIKPGITYTVEQLWQGVFLRSGNDAVHVLSHMNGGVPATVAEMQALAKDLQALDTHVVSPDGFDHKGQLSSAYDLALFARHGLADADFRAYCSMKTADFPAGGKKTFQIQNTDRLLTGAWGMKPYEGLIGVKNGYTSHAGNTFTGAATRDGRTLLVTVMHPKSGGNGVYEETARLLDWGFGKGAHAEPVGRLVDPISERGAGKTPARKAARAAAGAPAPAAAGESDGAPWGLIGGAGAAVAILAGGALALRTRRRRSAGERAEPADSARTTEAAGTTEAARTTGAAESTEAAESAGTTEAEGPRQG
ncbi:serine hydrolase [Streptomyces populi]